MSQKLHYACKHCLTSSQIFTTKSGHHAFRSCEPVSVHRRVTETTKHLNPLLSPIYQEGQNDLGGLPWKLARGDRLTALWYCSCEYSKMYQCHHGVSRPLRLLGPREGEVRKALIVHKSY